MPPSNYLRLPYEVRAMQFNLGKTTKREILEFCPEANVGAHGEGRSLEDTVDLVWISLPGNLEVIDGDFIVQESDWSFSVWSADAFLRDHKELP